MRKITLSLLFLITFLLGACAPAAQQLPPPDSTATSAPEAPTAAPAATEAPADDAEPTEAAAEPLPVPTSRGDALVASDPAQVNLDSGRLVLIEFFRFT